MREGGREEEMEGRREQGREGRRERARRKGGRGKEPDDDSILDGEGVGWQPGNVPVSNLHRLPKSGGEGEVSGAGDVSPLAHLTPHLRLLLREGGREEGREGGRE